MIFVQSLLAIENVAFIDFIIISLLTATNLRDTGEDIANRERLDDEARKITDESLRGKCSWSALSP